jgi:hypothetical protein
MRRGMGSTVTLGALCLAGCVYVQPVLHPAPWDAYGNAGPLRVHGTHPATAGQVVFRALQAEPQLHDVLVQQGEPDTIQVTGERLVPKRIVLTYRRPSDGPPRRIVVEPTSAGYLARAPEPLRTDAPAAAGPAAVASTAAPGASGRNAAARPSVRQDLECPIDPGRAECRHLCSGGARFEWCR